MGQTVYNTEHQNGIEGASLDHTNRRVVSRLAEGVIAPGRAVTLGTDPMSQRKLIGAALTFQGVALQHNGVTLDDTTGLANYRDEEGMSVLEKGQIWVQVDGAVTIGAAAYALVAVDIGRFTATAGANIATGGVFKSATAGAGLAIMEL